MIAPPVRFCCPLCLGLPLGLEAPAVTLNGVIFLFFSSVLSAVLTHDWRSSYLPDVAAALLFCKPSLLPLAIFKPNWHWLHAKESILFEFAAQLTVCCRWGRPD